MDPPIPHQIPAVFREFENKRVHPGKRVTIAMPDTHPCTHILTGVKLESPVSKVYLWNVSGNTSLLVNLVRGRDWNRPHGIQCA